MARSCLCFAPRSVDSDVKDAEAGAPAGGEDARWHDASEDWDRHSVASSADLESEALPAIDFDWTDETQMLPASKRKPLPLEERLAAIAAVREAVLSPSAEPSASECAHVEDRSNAALERFLRARKYDVHVSAALYLEHRKWREAFHWVQKPDTIPNQLAQKKVHMQGLCCDGLPFVVVTARHHIPTGKAGLDELFRFFVYVMDTISTAMGPGGASEGSVSSRSNGLRVLTR